jgi:N-acetylglucosaminyldiphosphoundecaprenol N-acetyl-beta-D-mannosaminyltransferase
LASFPPTDRQRGFSAPQAGRTRRLIEGRTHELPRSRWIRLVGARFAAVTEAEAVELILDAGTTGRGHWTITANLDHIRRYQQEPIARHLINSADLVVADGMPLIWASRLAGARLPERVAGSNMIWPICEAARVRRQRIFLLGGAPGVAERAAEILSERFEGLEIVGALCPRGGFEKDPSELERIERLTSHAMPHIVFVALGFPKQDLLIERLRNVLPYASFIGVGISLSYLTGDVPRAPGWTHPLGLEWLYRLVREPRRLGRRYLVDGVPFALYVLVSAVWHRARAARSTPYWGWEDDAES